MTDKELLELAAKAAGIEPYRYGDAVYPRTNVWNPLTDDGDALRLACKLELTIHHWPDEICVYNVNGTINEDVARVGDIYAATRRAIVRAAAEIGKDAS